MKNRKYPHGWHEEAVVVLGGTYAILSISRRGWAPFCAAPPPGTHGARREEALAMMATV